MEVERKQVKDIERRVRKGAGMQGVDARVWAIDGRAEKQEHKGLE